MIISVTTIFYVSFAAMWVLVIFHSLVLLELVRQQAIWHAQQGPSPAEISDLLETGTSAPEINAPDVYTGTLVSSAVWRGSRTVLVFVSPTCTACELVADELQRFSRPLHVRLILICHGNADTCKMFANSRFPGKLTLLDSDNSIAQQFRVRGTPTAVIIDEDWRILRYGFPKTITTMEIDSLLQSRKSLKEFLVDPNHTSS